MIGIITLRFVILDYCTSGCDLAANYVTVDDGVTMLPAHPTFTCQADQSWLPAMVHCIPSWL